jgi:hypothetical protein
MKNTPIPGESSGRARFTGLPFVLEPYLGPISRRTIVIGREAW